MAHPPGTRLRPGLWLRSQDRPSRRPGLSRYGVVFPESDTPQPEPDREELRQLLSRRRQLVEQRIQERNRLDKGISASVAKSTGHHIHWLDEEIEQLNEEYQDALRRSPDLCGRAELYRSVPGVGQLTAAVLAAWLPELGHRDGKALTSLVGLAPWSRDSVLHVNCDDTLRAIRDWI